jgi:hypothetical protein
MYRIELSPGEEAAFRSIEELAVAIRRKVVTSRARIYHNATARWLPIQFHPHYKLALSMPLTQADLVAGPPVTPLSALKLGDPEAQMSPPARSATREAATQAALAAWPEPKPPTTHAPQLAQPQPAQPLPRQPVNSAAPEPLPITLGTPAPEPRRVEPHRVMAPRVVAPRPVEPPRHWEPTRTADPTKAKASRRHRRPKRPLRVALAGAVLIACAHLLISATSRSSETPGRPRMARHLIEAPAPAVAETTPRTVAAVLPGLQSIPVKSLRRPSSSAATRKPVAVRRAAPTRTPGFTAPALEPIDSTAADDPAAPSIQAAPDAAEMTTSVPAGSQSLAPNVVDSSGSKTLKRLLRTIGGTPSADNKAPRR